MVLRDGWPIGDDLAWSRALEVLGVIDPNPTRNRPVLLPIAVGTVDLVRYPVAEFAQIQQDDVVTSTGPVSITVPDDEDWLLHAGAWNEVGAGTWTFNKLRMTDPAGKVIDIVSWTSSEDERYVWAEAFPLPHGWKIGPYIDSHSVNSELRSRLLYTRYRRVTTPG